MQGALSLGENSFLLCYVYLEILFILVINEPPPPQGSIRDFTVDRTGDDSYFQGYLTSS